MKEVICGVSENGYTEVRMNDDQSINSMTIVIKGSFSLLAKLKNVDEEGHGH